MITRRATLLSLFVVPLASRVACATAGPVNQQDGLAIAGHDPVAYFTDLRAVPGSADITASHGGTTYRFASAANRDAFIASPARYLPQYGGYCAYGVARSYKAVIDPTAFTITDGRLYLNYNAAIQATWRRSQARDIARADRHWPEIINSPELAR